MKVRGCFDEVSAEVSGDVSLHREARVRGEKEGNSVWMGSDEVGHGGIVVRFLHCFLDGSGAWPEQLGNFELHYLLQTLLVHFSEGSASS